MNNELLTASKVAQILDISVYTLNNWYKWQEEFRNPSHDNLPRLPEYTQPKERGVRYWKKEDVSKIEAFKNAIPKGRGGIMGDYSAKLWGERGKRALENKKNK